MKIGGITPFTSIDFPDLLAAVLFCQGCPWRCGYCHNPHLQSFSDGAIPWERVIDFLKMRQGFLDAVVLSGGGEPTMQKDLPDAMQEIRALGSKIGLHTAGMHPAALKAALPYCDWVGMDIKAPFDLYERVTRIPKSGEAAAASARMIIDQVHSYEFRTTVHPQLLSNTDILRLGTELAAMGAKHFVLQSFRPLGCEEAELAKHIYQNAFDPTLIDQLNKSFQTFSVRD